VALLVRLRVYYHLIRSERLHLNRNVRNRGAVTVEHDSFQPRGSNDFFRLHDLVPTAVHANRSVLARAQGEQS